MTNWISTPYGKFRDDVSIEVVSDSVATFATGNGGGVTVRDGAICLGYREASGQAFISKFNGSWTKALYNEMGPTYTQYSGHGAPAMNVPLLPGSWDDKKSYGESIIYPVEINNGYIAYGDTSATYMFNDENYGDIKTIPMWSSGGEMPIGGWDKILEDTPISFTSSGRPYIAARFLYSDRYGSFRRIIAVEIGYQYVSWGPSTFRRFDTTTTKVLRQDSTFDYYSWSGPGAIPGADGVGFSSSFAITATPLAGLATLNRIQKYRDATYTSEFQNIGHWRSYLNLTWAEGPSLPSVVHGIDGLGQFFSRFYDYQGNSYRSRIFGLTGSSWDALSYGVYNSFVANDTDPRGRIAYEWIWSCPQFPRMIVAKVGSAIVAITVPEPSGTDIETPWYSDEALAPETEFSANSTFSPSVVKDSWEVTRW